MGTILKKKNMFTSINYNDSSQRVTLMAYSTPTFSLFKKKPEKEKILDNSNEEKKEVKEEKIELEQVEEGNVRQIDAEPDAKSETTMLSKIKLLLTPHGPLFESNWKKRSYKIGVL